MKDLKSKNLNSKNLNSADILLQSGEELFLKLKNKGELTELELEQVAEMIDQLTQKGLVIKGMREVLMEKAEELREQETYYRNMIDMLKDILKRGLPLVKNTFKVKVGSYLIEISNGYVSKVEKV